LAAVAAAGLIAGVFARELLWPIATVKPSEPAFARAALGAHAVYAPEVRHPVEVAATEEKHLVTWLSKRLGTAVRPPKLTDYGWSLIGGRLIADGERPAAQFMYEDKTGRRMTLFVRPATGLADRAFQFAGTGATASFHWIDGATGYALTGDIERRDLHILARTVHAAIAANGPGMPADAGGDGR
jgi:anti-sigma factor RsiW